MLDVCRRYFTVPFAVCAAAFGAPALDLANDAEAIRDVLVARADSVASFSGAYVTTHIVEGSDPFKVWREMQFSGPDVYWHSEWTYVNGDQRALTVAELNGVITSLDVRRYDDKPAPPPSGQIGRSRWPYPVGTILEPRHLIGYTLGRPLADALDEGELVVRTEGDYTVLTVLIRHNHYRLDCHLDDEYRLIRIEGGLIPKQSLAEKVIRERGVGLLDLFRPKQIREFSDYVVINGIDFPLRLKRTTLRIDKALKSAWIEELESGKIDETEFALRKYSRGGAEERAIQTIEMDPETVCLNPILSDEDFRILFPEGTLVVDMLVDTWFVVGKNMGAATSELADIVRHSVAELEPVEVAAAPLPSSVALAEEKTSAPLTVVRETTRTGKVLVYSALVVAAIAIVLLASARRSRS
ncbi:MAG TPA: hypothetical protein HPP77_00865 [Candidatus Hydrogenedentes bacterium]|nr:hypothetical protein [Candidatus Hydrogenedentota bacterium]HIJ74479.1 hypothetical protein [Candidatus Hydrogenedentota bacterium]